MKKADDVRLKVALAKGSLLVPTLEVLGKAGFDTAELQDLGRKLMVSTSQADYIIARASDVPTFVEHGAVDIGFVGKDVLMESEKDVFELLDLGYGKCVFALAEAAGASDRTAGRYARLGHVRVATKYPKVAEGYFTSRGRQIEIIKLYGSVELAPLVGLADQIVDLVSTGKTLAENHLVVVEEIATVSCRLIANYVSYKLKCSPIDALVAKLKAVVKEGPC